MSDQQPYQPIIVAVDFSAHSEAALQQAFWLAHTQGASVVLALKLPDLREVAHRASALAKLVLLQGDRELFLKKIHQPADGKMRRLNEEHRTSDLDFKYETLLGEPFVELTAVFSR